MNGGRDDTGYDNIQRIGFPGFHLILIPMASKISSFLQGGSQKFLLSQLFRLGNGWVVTAGAGQISRLPPPWK